MDGLARYLTDFIDQEADKSIKYDYINQFNTQLTPEEEEEYQVWKLAMYPEGARQEKNYDMRGYWRECFNSLSNNISISPDITEKYKKPNHPTFSNMSIYAGNSINNGSTPHTRSNLNGGDYIANEDGSVTFRPNEDNMWSKQELANYIQNNEPTFKLWDDRVNEPEDFINDIRSFNNMIQQDQQEQQNQQMVNIDNNVNTDPNTQNNTGLMNYAIKEDDNGLT